MGIWASMESREPSYRLEPMKAGMSVGREERWAERPARIMVMGGAVGLG